MPGCKCVGSNFHSSKKMIVYFKLLTKITHLALQNQYFPHHNIRPEKIRIWILFMQSNWKKRKEPFFHRCFAEVSKRFKSSIFQSNSIGDSFLKMQQYSYRSSHWRCSVRKAVLKNFAKFTRKHLC